MGFKLQLKKVLKLLRDVYSTTLQSYNNKTEKYLEERKFIAKENVINYHTSVSLQRYFRYSNITYIFF